VVGDATGELSIILQEYFSSVEIVQWIYYNELKDLLGSASPFIIKKIGPFEEVGRSLIQDGVLFDNIFLINVLEHLRDSKECLQIVSDLLRSGGRAFISTDDGGDVDGHRALIYEPDHFNIFTEKSFRILISEIEGLEIKLFFCSPFRIIQVVLEKR
jgi:SAM-dependent methyltransferase